VIIGRVASWGRRLVGSRAAPGAGSQATPLAAGEEDVEALCRRAELATDARAWEEASGLWHEVLTRQGGRSSPRVYARSIATTRRAGDLDAAEEVAAKGLARHPRNGRLWREAAEIAFERQDLVQARDRLTTSLEHEGAGAPARSYARLASALRQLGDLERAEGMLSAGLERYPDAAELIREQAQLAVDDARWVDAADLYARLRTTARGPAAARLAHQHGFALERSGDCGAAAEAYAEALALLDEVDHSWANEAQVTWRFRRAYTSQRASPQPVADARLGCEIAADGPEGSRSVAPVGSYGAVVTHKGIRIDGHLERPMPAPNHPWTVEIHVDGVPIRVVAVESRGSRGYFAFHLKHDALATFPAFSRLAVLTPSGQWLHADGRSRAMRVSVPHGDGSLHSRLQAGELVTKKGTISDDRDEVEARLASYTRLRRHLRKEGGQPLVLLYGTLLGYHRDGCIIPGDDDVDVGFVTEATSPAEAKTVAISVVRGVLRAGFDVTTRFGGGLFKVIDGDVELDVYPLWAYRGRLWGYDSIAATIDDILPARRGRLHEVDVDVPRRPEPILASTYGPGWRLPEPGFRHLRPAEDLRVLTATELTPREGRHLESINRAERELDPTIGRFVTTRDSFAPDDPFGGWQAAGR
jgi:tetratricopeptide (TPR) repeat protein